MKVRAAGGLVVFEVDDDSAVARRAREGEIREQFERNFGSLPAEQIESMVSFEMVGISNAERVDRSRWCECSDPESSYYRTDTSHGFFHDPAMGGCAGITQTG